MFLGDVRLLGLGGSQTHLCGLIPSHLSPGTTVRTPAGTALIFPVCSVLGGSPAKGNQLFHEFNCLAWGQQTLSVKVQIVSILGLSP